MKIKVFILIAGIIFSSEALSVTTGPVTTLSTGFSTVTKQIQPLKYTWVGNSVAAGADVRLGMMRIITDPTATALNVGLSDTTLPNRLIGVAIHSNGTDTLPVELHISDNTGAVIPTSIGGSNPYRLPVNTGLVMVEVRVNGSPGMIMAGNYTVDLDLQQEAP